MKLNQYWNQTAHLKPALFQQYEGFKSSIPIGSDVLKSKIKHRATF